MPLRVLTGISPGEYRARRRQERDGPLPGGGDDRPPALAGAAHVSNTPVSVRLLDRDYTVGVEPGGEDSLQAAARLLDARMREIRGASRTAGIDRVAVLAALNLAHELQLLREQVRRQEEDLQARLARLHRRLDHALDADGGP